MPRVSVIIPNYNHAPFLEQRIESVLKQTYQDFEIILLDDASTDTSPEILTRYTDFPQIQVLLNKVNCGSPFKQWNKGISYAQGEYIWIAESDDYADPIFLETLVAVLDQHPNVGLAYCQSCSVNQDNQVLAADYLFWTDELSLSKWKSDFTSSGLLECQEFLICKNTIPNASAVLFRREVYSKISRVNESFKVAGDWVTWAEILFVSDIYFVAQPLNYFRVHCSNTSRNLDRLGLVVRESLRIVKMISAKTEVPPNAEQISFRILFDWWMIYLWSARFSWKEESQTFLSILSTYQNAALRRTACIKTGQFLALKLRSHLKLGTKLRSGFRFNLR
jgi:glycosyltransferase involved in cell wall biosynthesis